MTLDMSRPLVVAIDGPSGSGKSSTARGVASRLGLAYLDTGAMYRAAAIAASDEPGLGPEDTAALVEGSGLRVRTDPADPRIWLGERDVTRAIRDPEVSATVSRVATMPPVRAVLQRMQRDIIASSRRIVAEGRDVTTVVAPDADVRVLLVADPTVRMARREAELHDALSDEELRDQVLRRDRDDSTVSNFTVAADGVITIDSSRLSLEQVVDQVCALTER